jgi:hypothetical protein
MNRTADQLELLDRLEARLPELDLDQHEIEWQTLDDGHEALIVDGGGLDGGTGMFFANAGEDVHAVGTLSPLAPGQIGCIVIKPDGSRILAEGDARPAGTAEARREILPGRCRRRTSRSSGKRSKRSTDATWMPS